jgi:hypothetical protein
VREEHESAWRGSKDNSIVKGVNRGESCEADVEFFGDSWAEILEDEDEEG